ncbi:MAG: hypothetical protein WBD34_20120 [Burkholderiaceae bacterium]
MPRPKPGRYPVAGAVIADAQIADFVAAVAVVGSSSAPRSVRPGKAGMPLSPCVGLATEVWERKI